MSAASWYACDSFVHAQILRLNDASRKRCHGIASCAALLCALRIQGLWQWVQVRVCTRMGVQLVSTDFKSRDYYSNIRKAITAGYFMQVCSAAPACLPPQLLA